MSFIKPLLMIVGLYLFLDALNTFVLKNALEIPSVIGMLNAPKAGTSAVASANADPDPANEALNFLDLTDAQIAGKQTDTIRSRYLQNRALI